MDMKLIFLIGSDATMLFIIGLLTSIKFAKIEESKDSPKELHLPKASEAHIDEDLERRALKINLLLKYSQTEERWDNCRYIFRGKTVTISHLEQMLVIELADSFEPDGYSSKPVMIRADRYIEYRYVQELFTVLKRLRVWKLSFVCTKPEY